MHLSRSDPNDESRICYHFPLNKWYIILLFIPLYSQSPHIISPLCCLMSFLKLWGNCPAFIAILGDRCCITLSFFVMIRFTFLILCLPFEAQILLLQCIFGVTLSVFFKEYRHLIFLICLNLMSSHCRHNSHYFSYWKPFILSNNWCLVFSSKILVFTFYMTFGGFHSLSAVTIVSSIS